jgi:ABC-type multidrug transport system ATPase subunit
MRIIAILAAYSLLLSLVTGINSTDEDTLLKWSRLSVKIGKKQILTVGEGAILRKRLLAVLGPSGAGKTTFLNTISGRCPHSTSDVIVPSSNLSLEQSNIAFVYQEDSFFPMLTVFETVTLAYNLHKMASYAQSDSRHRGT